MHYVRGAEKDPIFNNKNEYNKPYFEIKVKATLVKPLSNVQKKLFTSKIGCYLRCFLANFAKSFQTQHWCTAALKCILFLKAQKGLLKYLVNSPHNLQSFSKAQILIGEQGCVPLTISYHLYFFRISKVWSMLHYASVGRVHSKECYLIITYTFLAFFCLIFIKKKNVFLSFSFLFLMKYRISTTEY